MENTYAITSIGHACCTLQRSYKSVQQAIEQLHIEPAATINGVPHYDDGDVERVREHLSQREAK